MMTISAQSAVKVWRNYRQAMQHEHSWEVAVQCPVCEAIATPGFRGWTPSGSARFGDKPAIYANLTCPKCAAPMQSAAELKLTELFSNVEIPDSNRRLLRSYAAYAVMSSLFFAAVLAATLIAGWQVPRMLAGVALGALVLTRWLGSWLNYAVACHRKRCDCGNPRYKFMGMLGRTYCYRCSSCGRLLRLRD